MLDISRILGRLLLLMFVFDVFGYSLYLLNGIVSPALVISRWRMAVMSARVLLGELGPSLIASRVIVLAG